MRAGLAAAMLLGAGLAAAAVPTLFDRPLAAAEAARLLSPAQSTLQAAALRGAFVQKKFLAGMPKPLTSTGTFVFARGQGVIWHAQKPFDSEFVLSRAGIVQHDAGAAPVRLSAEQQPALRVVADIFLSLFTLDLKLLSENFELYGMPADGGAWVLGLKPKPGALGGVLQQVRVEGAAAVRRIEFLDRHGDRTEIELQPATGGAPALTPDEAARFGP